MKPPSTLVHIPLLEAAGVAARVESSLYRTVRAAATPLQGRKRLRSAPTQEAAAVAWGAARADAPPPRSDHLTSAANAAICSEMG
eukprot:5665906-Prymnesium_polylepis.1